MKLFIDDERFPKDVTWVQYPDNTNFEVIRDAVTFESWVAKMNKDNLPEVLSFDHDLNLIYTNEADIPVNWVDFASQHSDRWEISGATMVDFLVDRLLDMFDEGQITGEQINNIQVFFHSKNPIGANNMRSLWNSFVNWVNT